MSPELFQLLTATVRAWFWESSDAVRRLRRSSVCVMILNSSLETGFGVMAYIKTIVCLANSFKIGGSCIAGREVLGDGKYGGWIRPVSERPTAEVWDSEIRYANNATPKLLDIIEVPLLTAAPHNHQTENHVIAKTPWTKVGELPWDELNRLHEEPTSLWINSGHTSAGVFNCIGEAEANTLHDSLVLIKLKDFVVEVGSKAWGGRTTKAYRGNFNYHTFYSLSITDPVAIKAFATKDEGEYQLEDVYLCLSLTEPWEKDNNRCHKLVASVFSNPPL